MSPCHDGPHAVGVLLELLSKLWRGDDLAAATPRRVCPNLDQSDSHELIEQVPHGCLAEIRCGHQLGERPRPGVVFDQPGEHLLAECAMDAGEVAPLPGGEPHEV